MLEFDLTSTLAPIGWAMISLLVLSAVGIWHAHSSVMAGKSEELPAETRRPRDEEHDESLPQAA